MIQDKLIAQLRKAKAATRPIPRVIVAGFKARGMDLYHWERNVICGDHYATFRFETCHGLVGFGGDQHEGLCLIAINNYQPGNGSFARLMDLIEGVVLGLGYPLTIVELWNRKLRRHLLTKRGYLDLVDKKDQSELGVVKLPPGWNGMEKRLLPA